MNRRMAIMGLVILSVSPSAAAQRGETEQDKKNVEQVFEKYLLWLPKTPSAAFRSFVHTVDAPRLALEMASGGGNHVTRIALNPVAWTSTGVGGSEPNRHSWRRSTLSVMRRVVRTRDEAHRREPAR